MGRAASGSFGNPPNGQSTGNESDKWYSEMYRQQRDLALNYHKRGIREKAKSIEASAVRVSGEYEIQIDSKEAIKVSYADKSSKIVKQSYCYTCTRRQGEWIIISMQDISK